MTPFRRPRQQRRATWVALLAVWMLALAPTLSHALAWAAGDNPWAQICTTPVAKGTSSAPLPGDATPPSASGHFEHCPFCPLGGAATLPPSPTCTQSLDLGPTQALPALYLHAPQPLFPWRTAQPRAPPSLV